MHTAWEMLLPQANIIHVSAMCINLLKLKAREFSKDQKTKARQLIPDSRSHTG
jgi:hypothetical protein